MSDDNKYFYVYEYVDPDTNKPFYVGKGQRSRAWSFTGHTHNKFLMLKLDKIRQKFSSNQFVIVVEENLTEEEAFNKEIELIQKYGKKIEGGLLFNVNDGGYQPPNQRGKTWKLSEDTKKKIKESWTKERREQMSTYSKNYKRTKEWCNKISESKRKYSFNKDQFEQLVKTGLKLKEILNILDISNDIMRDRLQLHYNTPKFREVKSLIIN
mgnify:CR=1 FL=1